MRILATMVLLALTFGVSANALTPLPGKWTHVECASVNGQIVGYETYPDAKETFTQTELLDMLLGDKQKFENPVTLPMPSDVYVNPKVVDIQTVEVKTDSPFAPNQHLFMVLKSENYADQFIFCSLIEISQ